MGRSCAVQLVLGWIVWRDWAGQPRQGWTPAAATQELSPGLATPTKRWGELSSVPPLSGQGEVATLLLAGGELTRESRVCRVRGRAAVDQSQSPLGALVQWEASVAPHPALATLETTRPESRARSSRPAGNTGHHCSILGSEYTHTEYTRHTQNSYYFCHH